MITKEEEAYIKEAFGPLIKKLWERLSKMIGSWVNEIMTAFFDSPEYKKYGNTEKAIKLFLKHRNKEAKHGK